MVPAPEIVFAVPVMLMFPADAAMLPETQKFPVMENVLEVVTDPVIVRLFNVKLVPLMVLLAPLIVMVPLLCVNIPEPVVARFPATVMVAEVAVIFEAVIFKL